MYPHFDSYRIDNLQSDHIDQGSCLKYTVEKNFTEGNRHRKANQYKWSTFKKKRLRQTEKDKGNSLKGNYKIDMLLIVWPSD